MSDQFPPPPVHAGSLLEDPGLTSPTELPVELVADVDPVRVAALEAAAHWHIAREIDPADVVEAARVFEAYLRGDR